ncbi:hypothetical protein Syun_011201 [Stephania yunnanensis]|uniref:Aberrant root formation protein 4 n=1 Tax=Stephania yunnanensis TaxID=152371 RepID=A0AAP0JX32_9MAGN
MSATLSADAQHVDFSTQSSANPLLLRLHQTLTTCAMVRFLLRLFQFADFRDSAEAAFPLLDILESCYRDCESDRDDDALKRNGVEILTELLRFVSSPSLDQVVMDVLSEELLKVVAKFAIVSEKCCEIVERIVSRFTATCSPRDMVLVLCEALVPPSEMFEKPTYFGPLLSGLSEVFLRMQRRQFEQIKSAMPVVLNVLKNVSHELDDEGDCYFHSLIRGVISIAMSIREVCKKLEGGRKEDLRALLGLFVLQIMAFISHDSAEQVLIYVPFVSQLSNLLPFCNLSYLGLLTGTDIEKLASIDQAEETDDCMSCFSHIKHGAALSVVWGHVSDEVMKAAEEDFAVVIDNLRDSQTGRWEAVGMIKYVLSSIDQPWELKKQAIDLLLSVTDGNTSQKYNYEHADCSIYLPSLFSAAQAIEKVIVYAPDAVLRKNSFALLKRILDDVPPYQRFDILKALITNSNYHSMIAILMDLAKEEVSKEYKQRGLPKNDDTVGLENELPSSSPFLGVNVLQLVEYVLKPPKGECPSLPEESDAVLSALNLLRFILIAESTTGRKTYPEDLLKKTLQKAYTEWLLPLRTLVAGIEAENEKDDDQLAIDTICSLNPVQLVLYRCIELVEERLQHRS